MANKMQIKLQTLLPIKWRPANQLAFSSYRLNGIRPINWPPQKADLIASGWSNGHPMQIKLHLLPIKWHSANQLATNLDHFKGQQKSNL